MARFAVLFEHFIQAIKAERFAAADRGWKLLNAHLTPEQRVQFERHRHFEVVGGESGRRYRIRHGHVMNIDEYNHDGRRVAKLCFAPAGRLVMGDVLLAQKLALEAFESSTLAVANRYPQP